MRTKLSTICVLLLLILSTSLSPAEASDGKDNQKRRSYVNHANAMAYITGSVTSSSHAVQAMGLAFIPESL